jgi:hypothetical protein
VEPDPLVAELLGEAVRANEQPQSDANRDHPQVGSWLRIEADGSSDDVAVRVELCVILREKT